MSAGGTSGVDLARVALRAAVEAARKNGSGPKPKNKPRVVTTVRRDGREPMGLGAALGALITERAWTLPAAGASLRERWAAIAPELAGRVTAAAFDPDSGRLTVCPESSGWATRVRLEQPRIIAAANKAAGRSVVSSLRILPPGAAPVPDPAAPTGPAKTRATACEGYRRALAAHQKAAPPRRVDPGIAQAVARQARVLRELSQRAFPDPEEPAHEQPAPIDSAVLQRRREFAATETAALHRARAQRAQRNGAAVTLPQQSAPLRSTA
ncbi:DUF721 domain-containing protein [Streptomyces sp. NPDC002602]|uniref:DUF721 domain-containing protein n=1 Tax=Streptomyces sp. NPDC002602 TaxID=3364654 RepID=UPI003683065B